MLDALQTTDRMPTNCAFANCGGSVHFVRDDPEDGAVEIKIFVCDRCKREQIAEKIGGEFRTYDGSPFPDHPLFAEWQKNRAIETRRRLGLPVTPLKHEPTPELKRGSGETGTFSPAISQCCPRCGSKKLKLLPMVEAEGTSFSHGWGKGHWETKSAVASYAQPPRSGFGGWITIATLLTLPFLFSGDFTIWAAATTLANLAAWLLYLMTGGPSKADAALVQWANTFMCESCGYKMNPPSEP
jgi:hypothetical protein